VLRFCLLLLIIAALYFVIGVTVNFFVFGSRGAEIIPFLWFWKDLFALAWVSFPFLFFSILYFSCI
jgi:hypothetical protein